METCGEGRDTSDALLRLSVFVFSQTRAAKRWRKLILQQNGPTRSLVPNLRSVRQACNTQTSRPKKRTLRTRLLRLVKTGSAWFRRSIVPTTNLRKFIVYFADLKYNTGHCFASCYCIVVDDKNK